MSVIMSIMVITEVSIITIKNVLLYTFTNTRVLPERFSKSKHCNHVFVEMLMYKRRHLINLLSDRNVHDRNVA